MSWKRVTWVIILQILYVHVFTRYLRPRGAGDSSNHESESSYLCREYHLQLYFPLSLGGGYTSKILGVSKQRRLLHLLKQCKLARESLIQSWVMKFINVCTKYEHANSHWRTYRCIFAYMLSGSETVGDKYRRRASHRGPKARSVEWELCLAV